MRLNKAKWKEKTKPTNRLKNWTKHFNKYRNEFIITCEAIYCVVINLYKEVTSVFLMQRIRIMELKYQQSQIKSALIRGNKQVSAKFDLIFFFFILNW